MKRFLVIVTAAGLGAAIYLSIEVNRSSGSTQTGAPVPRATDAPRFSPGRPAPDPLPLAHAVPAARDTDSAEPANPRPTPSSQEFRDRFQAFFRSEAVDSSWNWIAADAVTKGVQAVLPAGSTIRSVECRGTLCRIETSHADVEAFRTWAHNAFLKRETRVGTSGFFASVVGEPNPGNPVVAVAYLAREGKQLPGPDALFAGQ
jgi:hypothetical protein